VCGATSRYNLKTEGRSSKEPTKARAGHALTSANLAAAEAVQQIGPDGGDDASG